MKLGQEHIGQKFKLKEWDEIVYFKLLAITSDGKHLLGEFNSGNPFHTFILDGWIPYEEPKKMCVMSPAVIKTHKDGKPYLSVYLFKTEQEAKNHLHDFIFLSWPATQLIDGKEVPVQYLVPEE